MLQHFSSESATFIVISAIFHFDFGDELAEHVFEVTYEQAEDLWPF